MSVKKWMLTHNQQNAKAGDVVEFWADGEKTPRYKFKAVEYNECKKCAMGSLCDGEFGEYCNEEDGIQYERM